MMQRFYKYGIDTVIKEILGIVPFGILFIIMKNDAVKILMSFLILSASQIGIAQQTGGAHANQVGTWQIIGTTEVRFTADHDGIVVQGPNNSFNHIKFKIADAPIRMVKMVVTYDSGSPDNIEILVDIPQGGESRIIDLRGVGQRKIRRIDFWYDTPDVISARAHVTVLGLK